MSHRRTALAALLAAVTVAATAPAAHAGALLASSETCAQPTLSQVFLPWLDVARYGRVDDGGFEAGAAGWTLRGASVADGNEPWQVAGDGGKHSLALPAGASAVSPEFCVGLDHPTMRFFARRDGGDALSALKVDVIARTTDGTELVLDAGTVTGDGAWAPSPLVPIVLNLAGAGETTPVRFRFTADGTAGWAIDDVYVDPWRGS